MQTITMYLRAASVKGTLVDEWNQQVTSLPALTRGMRAELVLKLVDTNGEPLDGLGAYASWDFAVADDWDTETTPQLRVTEGIAVEGNSVRVPLTETNTTELIAALGKNESATFGCELAGFETGETTPGFLLQFDISIRNRRADAGTGRPEPVSDGSYTAAQIRALFAAKMAVQLSDDGETWYDAEIDESFSETARWYRFRNALVGNGWSDPLPLLAGPRGVAGTIEVGTVTTGAAGSPADVRNSGDEHDAVLDFTIPQGARGNAATVRIGNVEMVESDEPPEVTNSGTATDAVFNFKIPRGPVGETGHESYLYVAYAENTDGRGFSLLPAASRKYRAEIQTDEPLETPTLSDFAEASWVKYLGDDSTVYGDVLVADADTSVAQVSRIVFENATIRRGIEGEVIVRFKEAGVSVDEMNRYATINGRTRLSSWTNGGGSPSAMPGLEMVEPQTLGLLAEFPNYSAFIG
ncbi:MAG: hypothetical protein J5727_05740 [Kiritimatiellae bacterium]|nr:hypothetical protein [Kiritimatiellia bacterium]